MVFSKVAKLLADIIEVDHEDILPETEFAIGYEIEAIDVAKLIIECEKNFKINIYDEDIHCFRCVKDIVEYIDRALSDV